MTGDITMTEEAERTGIAHRSCYLLSSTARPQTPSPPVMSNRATPRFKSEMAHSAPPSSAIQRNGEGTSLRWCRRATHVRQQCEMLNAGTAFRLGYQRGSQRFDSASVRSPGSEALYPARVWPNPAADMLGYVGASSSRSHSAMPYAGLAGLTCLMKRDRTARELRRTHDPEIPGSNPGPAIARTGGSMNIQPWEIGLVAYDLSLGCSKPWFKSRISHSSWASHKTAWLAHSSEGGRQPQHPVRVADSCSASSISCHANGRVRTSS